MRNLPLHPTSHKGAVGFPRGVLVVFALVLSIPPPSSFLERQLRYPRVRQARRAAEPTLRQLFARENLHYPPRCLFLRIFKRERRVEVWIDDDGDGRYDSLKSYSICALSGTLGPKRRQGDGQVPEGVYHIDRFNPKSRFYLSLGINYPNASDQILGERGHLGSDIFIHGSCATIGCIPLTDELIKELYWLAVLARHQGQRHIPVHIFPCRLDDAGWSWLRRRYRQRDDLLRFWRSLLPVFRFFERTHCLPSVRVSPNGYYETVQPRNADDHPGKCGRPNE